MVLGSGVDIVKIRRFEHWFGYSDRALGRVFNIQEVVRFRELFVSDRARAVQFLASRFAVKEAFYKALCDFNRVSGLGKKPTAFLELARAIYVLPTEGCVPTLPPSVVFQFIQTDGIQSSVSIAHESCCVVATVTLFTQFS